MELAETVGTAAVEAAGTDSVGTAGTVTVAYVIEDSVMMVSPPLMVEPEDPRAWIKKLS